MSSLCLLAGVLTATPAEPAPLGRQDAAGIEPLDGVQTVFGEMRTPQGYRLRTIVTRPERAQRPLPAVYFVQWLSCDSVAIGSAEDGWGQMLRSLVRDSGMVVMRLEKAGVGDSEGGPCGSLDYDTELAHHRLGLQSLLDNQWVDNGRVFVFGASMGANMAPLVAAGKNVRGVAVWGGGAHSWFERQLGLERRQLEFSGASGEQIDERMRLLTRFYSAFLLDRLSPEQIRARDPELGAAWNLVTGSDGTTQFGRPIGFHQQAQNQRWAAAWEALDAPVLALFGEYDWFDSMESVQLIGSMVNRGAAQRGEVRVMPGIDHHFIRYRSREEAFAGTSGQPDAAAVMAVLLPWMHRYAN